jgi:hypothetical protein
MSWWKKIVDTVTGTERKQVRARNKKGRYMADDKSTPNVNEAYKTVRVKKKKK